MERPVKIISGQKGRARGAKVWIANQVLDFNSCIENFAPKILALGCTGFKSSSIQENAVNLGCFMTRWVNAYAILLPIGKDNTSFKNSPLDMGKAVG